MSVRIRQTEDLELIDQLDRVCFPRDERLGKLLEASVWWVAELDGEPVAYAGIQPQEGGAKAFLCRAGVIPQARGGGLQKRLLRVRLTWARRHGIPRVWTYVWAYGFATLNNCISAGLRPYYAERINDQTFIYLQKHLQAYGRSVPAEKACAAPGEGLTFGT